MGLGLELGHSMGCFNEGLFGIRIGWIWESKEVEKGLSSNHFTHKNTVFLGAEKKWKDIAAIAWEKSCNVSRLLGVFFFFKSSFRSDLEKSRPTPKLSN